MISYMGKRPLKLTIRIPPYEHPRNAWRKKLHQIVFERQQRSPVRFSEDDKFEVAVRLYLSGSALSIHDLDNRLKDIWRRYRGARVDPRRNVLFYQLSRTTDKSTV